MTRKVFASAISTHYGRKLLGLQYLETKLSRLILQSGFTLTHCLFVAIIWMS